MLASCVSEPSRDELARQTVIVTQFAPGTDFTAFRTFAIGDSIDVVAAGLDGGQTVRGALRGAVTRAEIARRATTSASA